MCDEKALIFLCFDADVKYKSSSVCSILLLDLQPAQEQQTGTKCHGNTVAFDALSPVQWVTTVGHCTHPLKCHSVSHVSRKAH